MRRRRNVKVVATLGPASSTAEAIRRLFCAGADVFRINMSHADETELERVHGLIRQVEAEIGRPIGILVDLQGPKLRVGKFSGGEARLTEGGRFVLDLEETPGDANRVMLPHREVFNAIRPQSMLLLDDGRIRLNVMERFENCIVTQVVEGGTLKDRKGVNVPDAELPLPALSLDDRRHLESALNLGVDWIALSFVQRPEDVAEAAKLVARRAGVLAKIEKPSALTRLDEIIHLADALMVARGDLGVELPVEQVPGAQKRIIRSAREAGKPVVVATQMLDSMVTAPVPTRAEVSDVSAAVFEGADAVMLSAESAAGAYPREAVAMMDSIAEAVERDPAYRRLVEADHPEPDATAADAITAAASQVADTLKVASIVCYTTSGSTALRAARERPQAPILALTPVRETARRMALIWGIHAVLTEDAKNVDDMVERACRHAWEDGFAQKGERVVITAGLPFGTPGTTNLLRIAFVS